MNISVTELGTTTSVMSEESNLLHDFPRSIKYSDIDFRSNMKTDANSDPSVTSDSTDETGVEEVSISNLINREYAIDENLSINMSFDVTKIPESELTDVFDTVEKLVRNYSRLRFRRK